MPRARVLYLLPLLAVLGFLAQGTAAQFIVGTASIMAPSVNLQNNTGQLTRISLTVTQGGGVVTITGSAQVANNTQQSAESAAMYASRYLGKNFSQYNFVYSIDDPNANVSGPSGGAAMTILAISALSRTALIQNFTITGTINNGTVGPIGGVYDKSAAAARSGMKFILVPATSLGSQEDELYYLVQGRFGIPLIQVANISTATRYAFGKESITNRSTTFQLYTSLQVPLVQQANISCSNGCSVAPFAALANFTLNYTAAQISAVPSGSYPSIVTQMQQGLSQSRAIASKGYLYVAGDTSFLNYINAYFFSSGNATVASGLATLQQVYNYCSALTPPRLTAQNYEWVVQGELRQSWGIYTSSAAINAYNSSSFDTDQVLFSLYGAGESQAWCHAASNVYGSAAAIAGANISISQNLSLIAQARIHRASSYGSSNMYLSTAESAYSTHNYPLAMVEADYAYAEGASGLYSNASTAQLNSAALAIAVNSTYGAWATQYSNEAAFFVHESQIAPNSTAARNYAMQAYSAAMLAQQMSNDSAVIYRNVALGPSTTTAAQVTRHAAKIGVIEALMYGIIAAAIVVLAVDLVVLVKLSMIMKHLKRGRWGTTRRRRRR
jgi:predicted S18 family serine protease